MPRSMMSVASTVSDEEGPHHVSSVPHTDILHHPGQDSPITRVECMSSIYMARKIPRVMMSVASTLRRVRIMCRLFHSLIFSLTQDSPTTRMECISSVYLVRKMPRVMMSVSKTLWRVRTMCRLLDMLIFSFTQDSPTTISVCFTDQRHRTGIFRHIQSMTYYSDIITIVERIKKNNAMYFGLAVKLFCVTHPTNTFNLIFLRLKEHNKSSYLFEYNTTRLTCNAIRQINASQVSK